MKLSGQKELREAVEAAARRSDVIEAMYRFLARVDGLVASRQPTCWNRAACCHFDVYGHRLYVTTLEAAYFVHDMQTPRPVTGGSCPYAQDGRCRARPARPMGCRVFFCDPRAEHWQGPLSEQLLAELRGLHAKLQVPYHYAEWLSVLRSLAPASQQSHADGMPRGRKVRQLEQHDDQARDTPPTDGKAGQYFQLNIEHDPPGNR